MWVVSLFLMKNWKPWNLFLISRSSYRSTRFGEPFISLTKKSSKTLLTLPEARKSLPQMSSWCSKFRMFNQKKLKTSESETSLKSLFFQKCVGKHSHAPIMRAFQNHFRQQTSAGYHVKVTGTRQRSVGNSRKDRSFKRPGTTWRNLFGACAHQRSQTLRKSSKNSKAELFKVICCFLSQNHLPPPITYPKRPPIPRKTSPFFKEPPRPPPLKRLKKRRHQKVKSRWGVKVPIGSTSSGQLSNCRSTKRSWILKSSQKGSRSRGVGVGEKISVAEIVDVHWRTGTTLEICGFFVLFLGVLKLYLKRLINLVNTEKNNKSTQLATLSTWNVEELKKRPVLCSCWQNLSWFVVGKVFLGDIRVMMMWTLNLLATNEWQWTNQQFQDVSPIQSGDVPLLC